MFYTDRHDGHFILYISGSFSEKAGKLSLPSPPPKKANWCVKKCAKMRNSQIITYAFNLITCIIYFSMEDPLSPLNTSMQYPDHRLIEKERFLKLPANGGNTVSHHCCTNNNDNTVACCCVRFAVECKRMQLLSTTCNRVCTWTQNVTPNNVAFVYTGLETFR